MTGFLILLIGNLGKFQNKLIKKNSLSIQVAQPIADIFTYSRMVFSKSFLANASNIESKWLSNLFLNWEKLFKKETLKRLEEEKRNQDHQMNKDLQQEILLLQDEIKLREFDKNEADKTRRYFGSYTKWELLMKMANLSEMILNISHLLYQHILQNSLLLFASFIWLEFFSVLQNTTIMYQSSI